MSQESDLTLQALQSQLGQAHEALLLAQADAEILAAIVRTVAAVRTGSDLTSGLIKLKRLAREAHPGAALADEVAAARAEIERMISTHDMQMAESEHRGADARNDRNIMRQALDEIDKHVVGAYEVAHSDMPEPCEECGEMREIAAHALALVKAGKA